MKLSHHSWIGTRTCNGCWSYTSCMHASNSHGHMQLKLLLKAGLAHCHVAAFCVLTSSQSCPLRAMGTSVRPQTSWPSNDASLIKDSVPRATITNMGPICSHAETLVAAIVARIGRSARSGLVLVTRAIAPLVVSPVAEPANAARGLLLHSLDGLPRKGFLRGLSIRW